MDLETIKDNPFCNRTKYYKYPKNIGKNIFKENEKLFKKFMKEIFQSPLLEEIFYLTPEFNDFKYPLKDDEILNEMIDNTIFVPFFDKTLDGYTQKLFGKVYISNNLFSKQYNKGDIMYDGFVSSLNLPLPKNFKKNSKCFNCVLFKK